MVTWKDVADLVFPNINSNIDEFESKYPERDLNDGAIVTRFAPSPTGYLHTGSLFATLVEYRMAKQTNGIFYIRVEDTDKKREIEGSAETLIKELSIFGIVPDEGLMSDGLEKGKYGPYTQSKREGIYIRYVKYLLEQGKAYPCFCTSEDLDVMRKSQEASSVRPGYYGTYAKCSNLTPEQSLIRINAGEKYIIRFRSKGSHLNKVVINDCIRGKLELSENDQHVVILKSDNLPTYHFAHAVDDHLMRTTHVIRGEEWLPSTPIHTELFRALGWVEPKYTHLPTIMIMDGSSKRKLSKRKDPAAAVSYLIENGYPTDGIIEYLLSIVNSDFEPWRRDNQKADKYDFNIRFEKINIAGALFDITKLNDVCKNYISRLSKEEIVELSYNWAREYSTELVNLIDYDIEYYTAIMSIERGTEKPRKDFITYTDILSNIEYFYDDRFETILQNGYIFNEQIPVDAITKVIDKYIEKYKSDEIDKENWFNNMKDMAEECNFCKDVKTYKNNPGEYYGHIGDFAEIIRVCLSNRKQTPDLYSVENVMKRDRVIARLNKAKEYINK